MTEIPTTGVGIASRKAHPIFSRNKSSDIVQESGGPANDFCNLFVCQASWSNSDPRLRPPICCVIVGMVVIATGIVGLLYKDFPQEVQVTGAVMTSIGGAILLFSFGWIYVTRRAILKSLAFKARPRERICPKHGILDDCVSIGIVSPDPIMTRGLISIKYRSCDDTLPPGSRNTLAATKSVHVPQRDSYLSVESTCFQLIASPSDLKRGRENRSDTDKLGNNQKAKKHSLFEERYLVEPSPLQNREFLSQNNSTNVNNNNPAKQLRAELKPKFDTTRFEETEDSHGDIFPGRYSSEKNIYTRNQHLKETMRGDVIYDCQNRRNGDSSHYNFQRKYKPGRY